MLREMGLLKLKQPSFPSYEGSFEQDNHFESFVVVIYLVKVINF
jgi:hypothetical protein